MAKQDIEFNFVAKMQDFLRGISRGKGGIGELTQESEKLSMSTGEIRQKMKGLAKDIEVLKDVGAIRAKQAELKKLGAELDRINGKQRAVAKAPSPGASVGQGAFFGSMLGSVAQQGVASLIGGIKGVATAMIEGNAEMEQYQASFETMMGSVEGAKAHMADLKKFGASTPFEFPGLAKNSQLLQSFGMDAKDIMPTLKMLGDVSGGSQEKLDGLALVFAQVRSAGKMQGQDLMQMINQGFNPLQQIAESTGKSMGALRKEMEAGKISFDMVNQAFVDATSEGGKFYGMMEKQAGTFSGLASTFRDNIGEMTRDLGAPLFDSAKQGLLYVMDVIQRPEIRSVITALKNSFEDLQDKFDDPRIQQTMDGLIAALSWLAKQGIKTVSDMIDAYAAYTGGILDVADALGLLNLSNTANARAQIKVNEQLIKGKQTTLDLARSANDLSREYQALAAKSVRTAEEEARRKEILDELGKRYPEYIQSTDDFGTALDGVRKIGEETAGKIQGLTEDIARLSDESKKARFVLMQSELQDLKSELVDLGFSWEAVNKATQGLRGAKNIDELTSAMDRFRQTSERTILKAKEAGDFDEVKTQSRALEIAQKLYDVRLRMLELSGQKVKTDPTEGDGSGGAGGDDPAATLAGSVAALQEEIKKLEEQQTKTTRAGSQAYIDLGKRIDAAKERLRLLMAETEQLTDEMRHARFMEGLQPDIDERLTEMEKFEDGAVEMEQSARDRIRQLRIDLMEEESRRLFAEYALKLELLDREEMAEEERMLRKMQLERQYGKAIAEERKKQRQKEEEERDRARKAFEDRYTRPVAEAMSDLLATMADGRTSAAERERAFWDSMRSIATNAAQSILSNLITQGLNAVAAAMGLTAAQAPAAAAAGAMWAGPAALASTATFGGAAAAGAAGLTTTFTLAQLIGTPKFLEKGGIIDRPTFVAGEAGAEIVGSLRDLIPVFREAVWGRERRATRITAQSEAINIRQSYSPIERGVRAERRKRQRRGF